MKKNSWQQDLKNRQIKPREEAWNKISGQLHQKELAGNRKKYLLWIAAACIGGLLLYPFLFSTENSSTNIVDGKENVTNKKNFSSDAIVIESTKKTLVKENNLKTAEISTSSAFIEDSVSKDSKHSNRQKEKLNEYTNEIEHFLRLAASKSNDTTTSINQNALLLLAEVENEPHPDSELEIEINTLLAQVNHSINNASNEKLEAFAQAQNLLEETEDSLEKEDLKKRIWRFIKSNYENLETTLAGLK